MVRENPSWDYRRVHAELLTLGVKGAACTVWEILREAGIDPAPDRTAIMWASFLRSRAEALLAAEVIEAITLTGTRMYILAVIEQASPPHPHPRRDRVSERCLGGPSRSQPRDRHRGRRLRGQIPHPGPGRHVSDPVRGDPRRRRDHACAQRCADAPQDRDHATVAADPAGANCWTVPSSGNQRHLLPALREFEIVYTAHRPHQSIANARPPTPPPELITDPDRLANLTNHRPDRFGGILREHDHAA